MKINFDSSIKNLDGEVIKNTSGGDDIILKDVAVNALLAPPVDNKPVQGKEKLKNYLLAQKVNAGGEIELKVEEISLIKEKIGVGYATLIVGSAYKILDPISEE